MQVCGCLGLHTGLLHGCGDVNTLAHCLWACLQCCLLEGTCMSLHKHRHEHRIRPYGSTSLARGVHQTTVLFAWVLQVHCC
jgi:hypothetical protein